MRYWTKRNNSPAYAVKILIESTALSDLIAKYPESFKATEFEGVREAVMGNFSMYYRVDGDIINVLAFWDNRQDPDELHKIL